MQTTQTHDTTAVDLLSHVDDSHLLKRLARSVSAATHISSSSVFLLGLGVFSSIATRNYCVKYRHFGAIPVGLYTVIESPSGVGKTQATRIFQQPFYAAHKLANSQLPPDISAPALFTSNATPEALENSLIGTKGFFSCVSSEQGLFNSLFGLSYGEGRQSNNDLVLNGFDAGHMNSMRISRQGYNGVVAGGVTLFAQCGSVEKVLNASNGTGLSERFLMLSEPHNLGKRNHHETAPLDKSLLDLYEARCDFAAVESPIDFEECRELEIDADGWRMINDYRNIIEPYLVDGGRYSHLSLRGAAAKCDMQIMKVAANLHLLNSFVPSSVIGNDCVISAIKIVSDLIEHQFSMLANKGLAGKNAAHDAVMRMFDKSNELSDRQITVNRSNVEPFKSATGNRFELIRATLIELVEVGLLSCKGEGTKAIYTLSPISSISKPLQGTNFL